MNPTVGRKSCEELYLEAIESAIVYYSNCHVYPYTYQGTYYYRVGKYREAFRSWANAGDVIRLYTYSCRDDEEIYKEFLEIANEMIPHIIKTESSGHSGRSVLKDSEVFANILRLYDGICRWEEESLTPILHIGWAKPLVNTISKFDYDIRSQVVINMLDNGENAPLATLKPNNNLKALKCISFRNENQLMEGRINRIPCSQKLDQPDGNICNKSEILSNIADLTAACGEKILNPDFLLQGGGQLFTTDAKQIGTPNGACTKITPLNNAFKPVPLMLPKLVLPLPLPITLKHIAQYDDDYVFMPKQPQIFLHSQKMKSIKSLLLIERLNTHAISLQLTANSFANKKGRGTEKFYSQPTVNIKDQCSETPLTKRLKRERHE